MMRSTPPGRREAASRDPGASVAPTAPGSRLSLRSAGKRLLLIWFIWLCAGTAFAQTPNLVLRGEITRADHESYREIAFTVPRGVRAIEIALDYTRGQGVTIDLGVSDTRGLRGWSGGNKDRIVIGETSATPSYRAGPIEPGRWRILLGMPNAREGAEIAYEARITFHREDEPPFAGTLIDEARWYRGDLHAHTAHSDGTCATQSGARAPCSLSRTLDAAVERGLDFIAITDHNATSQFNEMRALQPAYDRLLLLPGRELTTFQGHANVIGTMRPFDFRVAGARTMNDVLRDAGDAFVSINHPASRAGEACMGCAWTAATDYTLIDAVEVTNGALAGALTQSAEGPWSGIAFWHARLNEGRHLIAIGGSDNHDPTMNPARLGAIGKPTTMVFAENLSQQALLVGMRSGRVVIDIDAVSGRTLEMTGALTYVGAPVAVMGGALTASAGQAAHFDVSVAGVHGAHLEIILDGAIYAPDLSAGAEPGAQLFSFGWISDGERHWLRVNVRDANGRLVLIGNPIFLNW